VFPARYDPSLHWLGWNPVSRNAEETDETVALIFEANPVALREHYYDVQRSGGSDDGDSPGFAGYFLDEAWQTHILFISRRLNDIIMDLMIKNEQYSHLPWTSQLGDLPEQLKEDKIN
jgi:hypothetical protein